MLLTGSVDVSLPDDLGDALAAVAYAPTAAALQAAGAGSTRRRLVSHQHRHPSVLRSLGGQKLSDAQLQ